MLAKPLDKLLPSHFGKKKNVSSSLWRCTAVHPEMLFINSMSIPSIYIIFVLYCICMLLIAFCINVLFIVNVDQQHIILEYLLYLLILPLKLLSCIIYVASVCLLVIVLLRTLNLKSVNSVASLLMSV